MKMRVFGDSLPNARLVMLKDCGHFTYLECPASVRENIDAFFRHE
jgi:pimeloyl-ACP methyl ester carboxylesterase